MKMKFNFGILKNKKVKFVQMHDDKITYSYGILNKTKEKNGVYRFTYDNGDTLEVSDIILSKMRDQANLAIDTANVIIFVTNLECGVTAADNEVAAMLRRSGKPVVLCVNKCDSIGNVPAEFYEFYNLGLGEPIAVSAVHGHGTGDLLDAAFEYLPPSDEEETESDIINVAVIGKPNAGKSSLVNNVSGEERSIVSSVAGTTRDAIDTVVENKYGRFNFIDTAGLRRKSRVEDQIEKYSVLRAKMAIERADVCVIMIDGVDGFTEQDSKIAGYAHEQGKACIHCAKNAPARVRAHVQTGSGLCRRR